EHAPNRLPARSSKRKRSLFESARKRADRILGNRKNRRQNHDGQDNRCRQNPVTETVIEFRQKWHNDRKTDQAVYDGRDTDKQIRSRTKNLADPVRRNLRQEDGPRQRKRQRQQYGQKRKHQCTVQERKRSEFVLRWRPV